MKHIAFVWIDFSNQAISLVKKEKKSEKIFSYFIRNPTRELTISHCVLFFSNERNKKTRRKKKKHFLCASDFTVCILCSVCFIFLNSFVDTVAQQNSVWTDGYTRLSSEVPRHMSTYSSFYIIINPGCLNKIKKQFF